ncbi:TonB-dependent receptor [Pelagerythrobacter marinus]|uniref:TonB-dependent receptor n=1 Tax=Pelagerythrobacter marinus TaxID=538382 RepID=UPI0020368F98|nr:TonB-dependent receptor [Pelagerythrobacter marinus]USA38630.1 TonB-dependent receptor [Pelagerythrobacter marinus]WPZ07343.1 TonB-dependent receptor [Pelagerythrobacter marinus]
MRFSASVRSALFAGVAGVALPVSAFAQEAPETAADPAGETGEVAAPMSAGEPIVVTATKREMTLQETPVSVSVTSGETLERAEIRDLIDLQTVAPSLRVSQLQSSANTTFIIRGFGNGANNAGIEPSVGVFIDGVFRSRSAGQIADIANVSRVEVLRGPQSTLFGKNASAGVISVVTRAPQFDFGGSVSATYGNFDQIVLKGDITGPISDSIAFSLDGSLNKRDGYVDVVNLDEKINERDRYSVRGQLLFENGGPLRIRAIGDYAKIDELCCFAGNVVAGPTVPLLFAVGGQIDPENLFSDRTYLNTLPVNEIENYGGSLQADLELGALTLTSITAYRELRSLSQQDVDFSSADVVSEMRDQAYDTFTQEFRIASDFDGPVNFLLGAFYFNEQVEQHSGLSNGPDARPFFDLLAGSGTPGTLGFVESQLGFTQGSIFAEGPSTREYFTLDNEAWSIFGTVDFEPFDGLTLTAGFNYTKDKKDFTLEQDSLDPLANVNLVDVVIVGQIANALGVPPGSVDGATIAAFQQANPAAFQAIAAGASNPATNPLLALQPLQFLPPFLDVPNAVEPGRTRDDDFSYTLRAAFDVTDRLNAYVTYATGFKASSVNLSRDSRPLPADYTPGPYGSTILAPSSPIRDAGLAVPNLTTGTRFAGPEEAEVYEIGLKGDFPGLRFNMALFDQTLEGFQSNVFTGTGFALANAGEQSTRGFEFDSMIQPADPLVFTFALTYLDPKYDSFPNSTLGDLSGARPAGIPEWTLATSATYTHEFGVSGNALIGRLDYYHESNTQITDGLTGFGSNEAGIAMARLFRREVNQVNASLTLALDMGLEISGFVRNLTNQRYMTQIFDGVAQAGTVSGYPNQPRTYGGTVRFKF